MAPSIAAAQAPQSTKLNNTARPVIPVIPLPYLKKKTKTPAATVATPPQEILLPEVSAERISEPLTPSPPLATVDATTTQDDKVSKDPEVTATSHTEESVATTSSPVREPSEEILIEETVESSTDHMKLAVESDKSSTLANDSRPATTEPQSSTFTMPPPFHPVMQQNLPQPDDASSFSSNDVPRQSPIHHAHPDLRNLRIGAPIYAESRGSSPLGVSTGLGIQYPPPDPMLNANGHSQRYPNGFSPMDPPPPPPGFFPPQDPYVAHRQMAPFTSPDSYSPSVTPGNLEQQRFPSYPSSVHNEFEGNGQPLLSRFATPIAPNGANGHVEDVHSIQQHHPRVNGLQTGSQTLIKPRRPIHPPFPMHDHLDGLLEYLADQFDDATFADYLLELHYSDGRAHPIRIPGHNLLFARSPALNNLMATTTGQLTIDGSKRLLRLETDDPFVTSDGFYMAVSRLYGGQLLDETGPVLMDRSSKILDSLLERFNLAIGYAAAGHILHISPVVDQGIMVASRLISWNTVESALDFAIDGGLDPHWTFNPNHSGYRRCTYGRMANHLIQLSLEFALVNFPANFNLDTSVPDFVHNSRLPMIKAPDAQATRPSKYPLIADPRLSSIKFGDVTFSPENSPEFSPTFVLSKLLISLPFYLLKYMLQHPRLGNVEGCNTIRLRQKFMQTVVEEREKRRLNVFHASIPDSERLENQTQWEAVGWEESITVSSSNGSPDIPILNKEWVGFCLNN